MNIETLFVILIISIIAALVARLFAGFTLAGVLLSFMLACLGALGGWFAQQQLGLPPFYTIPFPGDRVRVGVVWPGIAALAGALFGGLLRRRNRPRRRSR